MAMTSIIKAIQTKWSTLTFTGKPATLYFGVVPLESPAGSAVDLPICWLEAKGVKYQTTFEAPALFTYSFDFRCTDDDLATVESMVFGFLFNGSSPDARGGFIMCDTMTMPSTYAFMACQIASEVMIKPTDKRQKQALRAYEATVPFQVQVERIS